MNVYHIANDKFHVCSSRVRKANNRQLHRIVSVIVSKNLDACL